MIPANLTKITHPKVNTAIISDYFRGRRALHRTKDIADPTSCYSLYGGTGALTLVPDSACLLRWEPVFADKTSLAIQDFLTSTSLRIKNIAMASKQDIDFSYTTIDRIHRLALGETADLSGARYNGDFSMSLEEAQRAKHQFMTDQLRITEGKKVLDMGCGWGPYLNFVSKIGAKATGLTLSDGQYHACRSKGFDVHIKDVRTVKPEDFGTFDAVVSVGAFEHFCALEEYKAGKQENIYRAFFETVSNLLPPGGRFYLQTMTFSRNMLQPNEIDLHADKNSDAYICALVEKLFPGSWLPYGSEMIIRNAEPYFKVVNISSGRLDYIETILQWRKRFRRFNLKKYAVYLKFVVGNMFSRKFWHLIYVFRINPIRVCFERDIMEHYRIVFEKK